MPASPSSPSPSSDVLVATRRALHRVAEHVLAAARHRWDGHIGLRVTPGGFGTPLVTVDGVARRVRVEGTDLVVEADGRVERAPLTTLGATADLVGIEPGGPVGVYDLATPCDPDAPLAVDPGAAAVLAAWSARADEALGVVVPGEEAQLWPEHLDVAVAPDGVNLGGSPGDADHPEPYLYVGPWSVPEGPFWNEPWGRSWPAAEVPDVATAVALLRQGLAAMG